MVNWAKQWAVIALLMASGVAQANIHQWKETEYQTYSDKTHVKFKLINKFSKTAPFYVRIDDKKFPNKLMLSPDQEIELDITFDTPPGITSVKHVCTLMITGEENDYETCTKLTFKRY
ncbi:hypothetical protein VHA01S_038_00450 [Vibrio halioticoli NBRC 102217]|uniref:EfeO-type cupredoxin-like domain-containing protein n=1 Tax=Vibrio halioticoli NBRC 102217 TaxID=1219072 RepID=V5FN66_9VIBR|nr:hypothetical protein [Vibrio halioticoli]GAD90277.1 hypothetical protein VHA01S_038_00450 [Vibrio halioticoli NBRC 102217]